MYILIGLAVVVGAVALAAYLEKPKSEFALNALWVWLAASASNFVYEVLALHHTVPNAIGEFVAIFSIPAIIAVFLWRFFRLT